MILSHISFPRVCRVAYQNLLPEPAGVPERAVCVKKHTSIPPNVFIFYGHFSCIYYGPHQDTI